MGSTRFPGKIAQLLEGVPMLRFQVERVLAGGHDVAILTSDLTRDDPVIDIANEIGVPVVRGSESDVLERFVMAVRALEPSFFVRLTADCPLTDPDIITSVVNRFLETDSDYTSNIHPRTFPKGLDVEVIRSDSLLVAHEEAQAPEEREHVTPYLYRHPERFKLASIRWHIPLGHVNWSVDEVEDLDRVRHLIMGAGTHAPWSDFLQADGDLGESCGLRLRPGSENDQVAILEWRNDPVTVSNSRGSRPVGLDEHRAWYGAALNNPAVKLSVVEVDGVAVGMVRIDVNEGVGAVSISIAPSARGRGYGRGALEAQLKALERDFQVVRLEAVVRAGNTASRKIFTGCGFAPTQSHGEWVTYSWSNPNALATERSGLRR
jgi:spore coat polysaccharide biosynthesis protein SpsF